MLANIHSNTPAQVYPLAHTQEEFARQLREAIAINDAHRANVDARRGVLRADAGLISTLRAERSRRGLDNQIDWSEYFRNIGLVY